MAKQKSFEINEDVRDLHQQGIDLSKTDFTGAQVAYAGAMEMIRLGHAGLDELSARMHMARLLRDDGFLHVRKALSEDTQDPGMELYRGLGQLFTSMTISQLMKNRQAPRYSPQAWYELRSEHGATLGLVGRLGTAAVVLSEEVEFSPIDYYISAYGDLRKEGNRYYDTSNSMHAARHEIVTGRPGRASTWQDRAWRSLQRAKKTDKDNYSAAKETFYERKRQLVSQASAIESVKTAP